MTFKNLIIIKNRKEKKIIKSEDIEKIDFIYQIESDCIITVTYVNGTKEIYLPDEIKFDGIQISTHIGRWYTIDSIITNENLYFLCEHETYGDETANIIIDINGNLIMDDVWNGFEDYFEREEINYEN